jgi:hypothetical protein
VRQRGCALTASNRFLRASALRNGGYDELRRGGKVRPQKFGIPMRYALAKLDAPKKFSIKNTCDFLLTVSERHRNLNLYGVRNEILSS